MEEKEMITTPLTDEQHDLYAQPYLELEEHDKDHYRVQLKQGEKILDGPAIKSRDPTNNMVRLFCTVKFGESNVNGRRISHCVSVRDTDAIRKWLRVNQTAALPVRT
jgi:hypothetical protein